MGRLQPSRVRVGSSIDVHAAKMPIFDELYAQSP